MTAFHRVMTALAVWLIANIIIGLITVPGAAGRVPAIGWLAAAATLLAVGAALAGTWWVGRGWERDKTRVYAEGQAWTPPTDPRDTTLERE